MATLKQRLHRKNAAGTYDTIHLETSADLVLMTDGSTKLSDKISSMDTAISGKAAASHTHTTISGNAGTATKLATARTIRTNLASTATASFDGSGNVTPGVTGILPVANGGTGSNSLDSLKSTLGIGSPTVTAPTYPGSIPAVGNTLTWAGKTWRVVHKNAGVAFIIHDTVIENTVWSNAGSYEYFGSVIWEKCNAFAAANKLYACDYLIPMLGGPVWIPSYDQYNGGFSYFATAANRIGKLNGSAVNVWTSTPYSSSYVYCVTTDGGLNNDYYPSATYGFRPCVALRL